MKFARAIRTSLRELMVVMGVKTVLSFVLFPLTSARASSASMIWVRAPLAFVLAGMSDSSMGSAKPTIDIGQDLEYLLRVHTAYLLQVPPGTLLFQHECRITTHANHRITNQLVGIE